MSRISSLFNFREEHAKGRSCMALCAALVMTISKISAGMFYTSFMTAHGINIVELGVRTWRSCPCRRSTRTSRNRRTRGCGIFS